MVKKSSKLVLFYQQIATIFIYAPFLYCYDFPQLFEGIMIRKLNVTTENVQSLYTMAVAPSLLTSLFLGQITAIFGSGIVIMFSAFVSLAGNALCLYGIDNNNFTYLFIGRGIFGLGEGFLLGSQITVTERFFSGKFLSIALALNRVVAFVASSAAAFFEPALYIKYRNMGIVLFFYGAVNIFIFISGFSISLYDIYSRKSRNIKEEGIDGNEEEEEEIEFETFAPKSNIDYMKYSPKFSDLLKISLLSKLHVFAAIFFLMTYFTFNGISTDLLMRKFNLTYEEAKDRVAITPIIGTISILISSITTSRIGKKGIILFLAGLTATIAFIVMAFLPEDKPLKSIFIPIVLIGIFFGMYNSVLWPNLTLSSPKQLVDMIVGFGVFGATVGLAIGPLIVGYVSTDRTPKAYTNVIYLFLLFSSICLLLGFLIMVIDLKGEKVLHYPENDKIVAKIREKWTREFYELKMKSTNKRKEKNGQGKLAEDLKGE